MNGLKTDPPAVDQHLVAGRRAAYGELHVIARDRGIEVQGCPEAEYAGFTCIAINGVGLQPMIDAVVIETIVRLTNPEGPAKAQRRPWSKAVSFAGDAGVVLGLLIAGMFFYLLARWFGVL